MKNNKLFLPLAVVILVVIGGYYLMQPALKDQGSHYNQDISSSQVEPISYDGRDGIDVLTLLREKATIETQDFGEDLGEYVLSIDSKGAQKDYFWVYYVNGVKADSAASKNITKNSDKIEWKYEKFEF
ncbi:hypothetical protein COZ61_00045 [Candidatus Berkelbacteria bacterium CG_4_8_14_3_um_filter_33_6]|uniref:Transcobalamin-like C-terminal domain-containing protein n=1 Tax=Candidatus Berkelbacteria bacterium CG_4_10_14_0_2_um_filter_35_9_33_12 TaxID=1974499 RepID=A0A2M7W3G2_9BACT|nr:MAG: hypothetical protein COX10_00715 [Candidatus Berkelbacteria bacterium CG23_combo_of_CG06-09_8_20_14_all_33_15]PIX31376.1 MAG: hypothetical protein COZ61_00045 [Candidatus Berkelbacteria bacterium CG_4_8_14_3_um_filter_33_6]PJA20037.1 MAG: hypothetical protein COX60_03025 [Candidatus Berkelbacteria bacterium CG_4_10_14_0_2_um_filter_35_9_33_12]